MLSILWSMLWYLLIAVLAVVVVLLLDLLRLPKSRFHTWRSLVLMYVGRRAMLLIGRFVWWRHGGGQRQLRKSQEKFLLDLLRRHADTAYGRDHRFSEIHSIEDYRRIHPVVEYDHFKPYIDRVMDGEITSLYPSKDKVLCFYCSSGTTGASKYIPANSGGMKAIFASALACFTGMIDTSLFPMSLRKSLMLPCAPRWRSSPTGVKIGPASALNLQSPLFAASYTIPPEAVIIFTEAEAMHVGFILALRDRDVVSWEAGFAFGLWTQLQFLEKNWQQIVRDIHSGMVTGSLKISDEQRRVVNSLLSPEPERAAELKREFEKGMNGIIPRIFPRMTIISAMSSGISMAQYRERVLPYTGKLPIISMLHGASEGLCGINVRPPNQQPAYALIPACSFVEFLPVDENGEAAEGAEPLMAEDVCIGDFYEIVLTTVAGLYRYRLGDIVKIVGTYHQSPTYDFVFRRSQMLNVHMEKVSEASFTAALTQAVKGWPEHQLVDFTTAESVLDPKAATGAPPYYLVLLEILGPEIDSDRLNEIDASLQNSHYVYKSFRVKNSIGPMRVVRVPEGTFSAYRHHVIATTQTAMAQYKQSRVLRSEEHVRFFLEKSP